LEEQLNSLAWSILGDLRTQAARESFHESRLLIDAVRLSALTSLTVCRFGYEYLDLEESHLLFSSLSYENQRSSISTKEVGELVKTIIEGLKLKHSDQIRNLSITDFVDLLGRIHSLGSYHLPSSLKHASSQKPLGAFYTPQAIADYIVRLTLGPILRKHLRDVRKKGLSAVTALFSLNTIDPACGTGVFLIAALRAMQQAINESKLLLEKSGASKNDYAEFLANPPVKVWGVDIDSGALEVADISLRLLESVGRPRIRASHLGSALKQGNSLITLDGFAHKSDNRPFFRDPISRTPFEWDLEFKEVFSAEQRGFDFVVMNPPYERLKPNFAEFMREELLSGARENHASRFEEYKSHMRENTRYFRDSNEFRLSTSYSLNTYQLFIERALQISKIGGNIGFIVPSNILCDVSAQFLRQELLLRNVVKTIDDFPEASRIFPGVTQSVSILVVTKGGTTEVIEAGLNRTSVEDALNKKRLKIERERILRMMGPSLVIPRANASGLDILERMHTQPALSSINYLLVKRGELDLTLDRRYISSTKPGHRLIRGSNIKRYSLQESSRDVEFVNFDAFHRTLEKSERAQHISLNRIACQQVSNMGQRWRLKFAPIEPDTILSNSCNYLVTTHPNSSRILEFLLGVLNSELLNWRFQISNSNNHVSIRELQSLPIAQPAGQKKFLERKIVKEVKKLKAGKMENSSLVEAYVFSLYGLGLSEAQEILSLRGTPEDERNKILEELSALDGERLSN
jgi:adenine-specific DNA-methyltransferase